MIIIQLENLKFLTEIILTSNLKSQEISVSYRYSSSTQEAYRKVPHEESSDNVIVTVKSAVLSELLTTSFSFHFYSKFVPYSLSLCLLIFDSNIKHSSH